MTKTITTLTLSTDLCIGSVAATRKLFDQCLTGDSDVVVDAHSLQTIDTAGLQLLGMFARAAKQRGVAVSWRDVPPCVAQIAADLGWPTALDG